MKAEQIIKLGILTDKRICKEKTILGNLLIYYILFKKS